MEKVRLAILSGGGGAVIVSVLVILFQIGSIGVTTESVSTFQISPTSFDRMVENSEMIILGRVQKVETKLVDLTENLNPVKEGEEVYQSSPYLFVTIDVEEYLKDVTGKYEDPFTFNTFTSGIGKREGENVLFTNSMNIDYPIGERAVFFISDSFLGWTSVGYMHKFYINSDNTIQTLYFNQTGRENPIDLDEAKQKIPYILERQTAIDEYLNMAQTKEAIQNIIDELHGESIPVNDRTVIGLIKETLKLQYDSGKEFSINAEEAESMISTSWKKSKELEAGIGVGLSSSTET